MVQDFLVEQFRDISDFTEEDVRSTICLSEQGFADSLDDYLYLVKSDEAQIRKLAFLKRYARFLCEIETIDQLAGVTLPDGRFYVRIVDHNGCHGTEDEKLAGQLLKGKGRISFSEPDFVVLLYHADKWYVGIHKENMTHDDSNDRRAPMRPYFTPVSMDPRYASFLVNMGYFKAGSRLLDPFCGSSGILIEAAMKGYSVTGFDIVNEMVVGSRVNLKFFGVKEFDIRRQDFLTYEPDGTFDGIVTDFPYGRSSKMTHDFEHLYREGAKKMAEILLPGYRACIVTDREENITYFDEYFRIDKIVRQRIHRSLTRHFIRLIRK
ncbi:MAG: RsmD family RNA methyltransferase [Candidatus Thermoplasmatota archaeon]|nr:RsmD family RNA methyltransferase [Candidatus Thermoplasmatota archaeon]MCL5790358.1 RsmD family RNA methyltransferase [Candidatus Thermoplasmatota archaeon]